MSSTASARTPSSAPAPWWQGETIVRLSDVPLHVPLRGGRSVSVATVYRWTQPGGTYGIRLRRFRTGPRGWCTTIEEVHRYWRAVTAACGGDDT